MLTLPSRLGFGVSGAHGTPLMARADTVRLVHAAYEGGVRVFDTAPAYGAGEAERRLGLAVAELGRDRVMVTTKAGLSSAGLTGRLRDFSPVGIEESIRASLARLGLEGVDILFLHGASPQELTDALFKRLERLRAAGAFLQLGAVGRGCELDPALFDQRFAAIMAPNHPFLSERERARLQRAKAAGKVLFAIEANGGGAPPAGLPRQPADLYKLARALRAGPNDRNRGQIQMPRALERALTEGGADCALFTTTRRVHMDACLSAQDSA